MNIFTVDSDPTIAAQMLCDKHVLSQVRESTVLLCLALDYCQKPVPIDEKWVHRSYRNHPSTKWARACAGNFDWLLQHGLALASEYTYRYGKIHDCQRYLNKIVTPDGLDQSALQPFAKVVADDCKEIEDPIEAYRSYYINHKAYFAVWTRRKPPTWFPDGKFKEATFLTKLPTKNKTILRKRKHE